MEKLVSHMQLSNCVVKYIQYNSLGNAKGRLLGEMLINEYFV
jgi:hypothetical protein